MIERMKKVALTFSVIGSGLAAFGFAGWGAEVQPRFMLPGQTGQDWTLSAGWTFNNQLEITFGVALLVLGLILRKDSK